jgi:phospholipid/cholesterol/gamma-HCH transport system permease protein
MIQNAQAIWEVLSPQKAVLTLRGQLDTRSVATVWNDIALRQVAWLKKNDAINPELIVNASELEYVDSAGVAYLIDLRRQQELAKGLFQITGLDEKYRKLLSRFNPIDPLYPKLEEKLSDGMIARLGKSTSVFLGDIKSLVDFIGKVTAGFFWVARKPLDLRWRDMVFAGAQAGVSALPIVTLVAFLIGVILAFQSAVGLQQYGASSYVAPLVSKGIFRELGPLITAILFAGRSAAAFAAEIGTMTVNNEVDALTTAGINPIRFLVMPRVIAGTIVVPILTMFANLISVFAVMFTMTLYQIPFITSYKGLINMVNLDDIYSGFIKSVIFGVVVAGIGCMRGMQTGTGAAAVGISTTRAVVSSIVVIVLVDGIFAYISYKTGF